MSSAARLPIPSAGRYRLSNCTLPAVLTEDGGDGLVRRDIEIDGGRIVSVSPGRPAQPDALDLAGRMVLPCFVDMHTHIDKGHIWPRKPNPDGTFMSALRAVGEDRRANWSAADVRRRMEFALRCAYAHGTAALRTHLDSEPPQDAISWPLFAEMREAWKGRIELQAVALLGIDQMLDDAMLRRVVRCAKEHGGLLGGAMASHPRMSEALRKALGVAAEEGMDVDFHLDETQDVGSNALVLLADAVLDTGFAGKVTAGHCCALARQAADEAKRTIAHVAEAGVNIVSLPLCNLYLQDRHAGETPRYRGVTLIRELLAAGVNVSVASDNTRDPFYAYGDLDGMEVLRETVRIAHLDHPLDVAPALMTRNPARTMGVDAGLIAAGRPADLVILRGRDWSEALSRPETDRVVLRAGERVDAALPDYSELDC